MRRLRKIVSKYGYWNNFKNDKSEDPLVLKSLLEIWETYVKNDHTKDIFKLITDSHEKFAHYEYSWIEGVDRKTVKKWHGEVQASSDHYQKFICVLVSEIGYTEVKHFNGFKHSAYWRKFENDDNKNK